ncbi:ArsR/SmtB family transcription factor [Ktedonobacter racemifer]|uniref:Transcriptional regulator, ArsR family n=1 Tax=Ktedonobacter racemifer DSM 44963 TaxID=485913 RepID=D6U4R4_KTERA|nr:metalloregulator ArsR/SmtB family transcription factor [Ktedonobacter racemifer]EFH81494.1 transcriptional regulator, ArsR family [Ktedonobacter racemifer DSM 44963]
MLDSIDMVFAALANQTRRELLRLLRDEGPQPVQQLADHFAMQRPSISEHLKVLRDVGLVSEHKQGRQRYYSLQGAPFQEIQEWLLPYERFWKERIASLEQLLAEENHD